MTQILVYWYKCDREHVKNLDWNLYMLSPSPFRGNQSYSEFPQSSVLYKLMTV